MVLHALKIKNNNLTHIYSYKLADYHYDTPEITNLRNLHFSIPSYTEFEQNNFGESNARDDQFRHLQRRPTNLLHCCPITASAVHALLPESVTMEAITMLATHTSNRVLHCFLYSYAHPG